MARPVRSTDKLAAALKRKNPEAVLKQLGETLEGARQTSLARGRVAAEKERKALVQAVEARPAFQARAARVAAAAAGELAFAKTIEETHPLVARPDPKGLLIAGTVVAGRTGRTKVTVVFADDAGRLIEGSPEIAVSKSGLAMKVLNARELAGLQKALGDQKKARIALKIGQRIVSTTARPFTIQPGGALQFSLRRS